MSTHNTDAVKEKHPSSRRKETVKACGDASRHHLVVSLSVLLVLTVLLVACGGTPSLGQTGTQTPGRTSTPITGTTPTTVPMPPTETSCPPARTARAAIMALLVLGRHANVVYLENQGETAQPSAGVFKRVIVGMRPFCQPGDPCGLSAGSCLSDDTFAVIRQQSLRGAGTQPGICKCSTERGWKRS